MITLYNEKGEKLKLISVFEFNDADMGESSISATVSFSEVQDFHPDWYVVYNGEKFYLGVKKPTGKKDTSSLSTSYTLVFKSERENLKRYTFMDFVELGSDNPQPSSYKVSLYATLTELVDRFNLNLRYYLGNRWQMVLPQGYVEDGNAVSVSFDNASLWDVLLRFYEIYGVRWVIRSVGNVLQIQVGFEEVELEHVFEYGKDNGLVSVERNNSLERIITRLRGRGSEKNLPPDYFHSGDPDTNSSLQAVFFKNLMPKAYRDYIRGYNAGSGSGTWAYNQGVTDKKQGKAISPVDYALSDKENLWGISYGAIEPNEKIFPTLQGATRNGVRLDEVLAVEKVLVDGIREPQNTIAVKIGPGGSENSIGTCGTTPKYIDDCRNGINYSLNTDKFAVSNPVNKLQVRLTATPSIVNSEGFSESTQFGDESTVHITAVLSLMDFSKNITGEAIRTYTITDVDTFLWELDDIPIGSEYRLRADITWSARILKEEADEQGKPTYTDNSGVVVSISSGLTGATVWEYAREEDKGDWKETFDIEIRDVWGIARKADESDEDYTYRVWEPRAVSEDMTVMFSDGLLAGEDYEFRIVGFNSNADDLRQTIVTAIKPTAEGGWKLTLQKSDAELNAGNIYLPNTQQNAKPGDHFFFVNISMPYDPYVYDAEARLEDYLDEQLAMKDEEFPSFTITPSKIFCSSFSEVDKIKAGAKIRVKNVALIGDSYISLYIQSLTKRYSANSLNPEWSLTLSDLVVASGNPLETLEGQVNVLTQRVYSNRDAVQEAVRSLSSTFVRKDGIADVSYSPTEFKKKIELGEGITDKGFRAGDSIGQGFGVYTDDDGNRVIEADVLVGRIGARFNEVQINQVSYSAGKQVFSAAGMVVSKVEDAGTSWRCYFDAKNGTVRNYFAVNDGAFSQRFTDAGVRQYWARVTAIGADYIEISKTDRMQGSFDPLVGDNIAQLGNSTDKSRQAALVIDETHEGGGLVTWYDDITDFTLSGKDSVNIGRVNGKTSLQVYGSGYIGDRGGTQYVRYENGKLKVAGTLEVGTKLGDGMTVVEDGIVQSMLVKLGYVKDDVFQVMSGTNGLYDGKKLGGGIAAWYGGPMVDKEADKGVVDFAQSLFRFDGSGYLASGNITWDKDGAGHVAGGDLSWDKDGVITLGSSIKISGDVDNTLGSILEYVNELRRLWRFDKENNAVYTPLNLIVEGTIGMGSLGEGGSGEVATPNITIKFYGSEIPYTPDANGIITLPAYPEGGGGSGEGGITQVTAQMIEEALGYVPYSSKNPSGYITNTALNGYATEQWVADKGYITNSALNGYATHGWVSDNYLSKSGGTISTSHDIPLTLKTTSATTLWMQFILKDGEDAYIGFNSHHKLLFETNSIQSEILHSGNIDSYNAGSATKLQTSRTIWGQSFDGTGNVSGNLILGYNKIYLAQGNENYYLGWNSNSELEYTNYYGHIFKTGGAERMRITDGGNVLMGTTEDRGYRLQVEGSFASYSYSGEYGTLGTRPVGASLFGPYVYGLLTWVRGDGNAYMQVGRTDNQAIAYNLVMQHLGGNVLIGTTTDSGSKLQTKGQIDTWNDGDYSGVIGFNRKSTTGGLYNTNIHGWQIHNYKGDLQFFVGRTNGTTGRPITIIGGNENVLIGATDDNGAKLQVNGGITTYGSINMQSVGEIQNALAISRYGNGTGYYVGSRNAGLGVADGGCLVYAYGNTPISLYTNSSERVRISGSGNVIINSNTRFDSGSIFMNDLSEGIYIHGAGINFHNSNNVWVASCLSFDYYGNTTLYHNLTVTGDITSEGTIAMAKLASSSDAKLKENIKWLSADRAMEVVRALRPTEWDWKKDRTHSFGFIAQDVQPIIPEMVSSVNDTLRLEYNQLHAFEIGAIQHIDSEVEILKRRVNELENELKQYRRNA